MRLVFDKRSKNTYFFDGDGVRRITKHKIVKNDRKELIIDIKEAEIVERLENGDPELTKLIYACVKNFSRALSYAVFNYVNKKYGKRKKNEKKISDGMPKLWGFGVDK